MQTIPRPTEYVVESSQTFTSTVAAAAGAEFTTHHSNIRAAFVAPPG